MKKDTQQAKNEYQKILEKIQAQSKEKKEQRTINIMKGETVKNKSYQQINVFETLRKYLVDKRTNTTRYFKVKQNRHTAIMSVFLVFSTYFCWIIQKKYDVLRKKANKSQTFKEKQIQQQNEYIEKMLQKKQFESVPITVQPQELNTYKFQQNQTKRGGFVIDTKQDLFDLIQKDKINKKSAEQIYQEEIKRGTERI